MSPIAHLALVVVAPVAALFAGQSSADEKEVWSMEQSYWQYLQANDVDRYCALWHADFLGWPLSSPEPARKDHVTDWITARTRNGETVESYDLEPLAVQVTDNLATITYRVRFTQLDKAGAAEVVSVRIIHTWLRDAGGKWQIISGMSAPANAEGH